METKKEVAERIAEKAADKAEQKLNGVMKLYRTHSKRVDTEIRSLQFKNSAGNLVTVPKEHLVKGDKAVYRRGRFIPVLPEAASRSRERLLKEIEHFLNTINAYDSAEGFILTGGYKSYEDGSPVLDDSGKPVPEGDSPILKKNFKMLVKTTGHGAAAVTSPATPEEKLVDLINKSWTWEHQMQMGVPLRALAEKELRQKLGISAPEKKVRAKKVVAERPKTVAADNLGGLDS